MDQLVLLSSQYEKRHVTTGATSFASLLFKHNHATPIDNFSSTTNNTTNEN